MILSKTNSGFVALISTIIITVLLLTITFTVNKAGLSERFNILYSDSKERSSNLAEACADTAIYNLTQDSTYNPSNQVITISSEHCKIILKQLSGSNTIFETQAAVNSAYTNLKVKIDSNYNVVSWEEVPTY